jgi:hypothetical protein
VNAGVALYAPNMSLIDRRRTDAVELVAPADVI